MLKQNFKIIFCYLLIIGMLLPSFALAQGMEAPKTLEEAKTFSLKIIEQLPETSKDVWRNEVLPILEKMWDWVARQAKPIIESWRQKILNLLGKEIEKRKPALEKEIEKEVKEIIPDIKKSLWERFKALSD